MRLLTTIYYCPNLPPRPTSTAHFASLHHDEHIMLPQLLQPVVGTSGRRLQAWGNVYATFVHFRIALAWYAGMSGEQLKRLYVALYTDAYR